MIMAAINNLFIAAQSDITVGNVKINQITA